ncbi:hypothetical protein KGMB02707_03060 [Mesosutterella multiformis]|nr:hypothetical protein KGMB02707_03060 [Mesosutterella multiformis]
MFLHCQAFETDYLKDREAGFAGTRVTVSADPRSFTEKDSPYLLSDSEHYFSFGN